MGAVRKRKCQLSSLPQRRGTSDTASDEQVDASNRQWACNLCRRCDHKGQVPPALWNPNRWGNAREAHPFHRRSRPSPRKPALRDGTPCPLTELPPAPGEQRNLAHRGSASVPLRLSRHPASCWSERKSSMWQWSRSHGYL